ncbi:MAG: hypothetical protein K9N11_07730 [Lentisphaeria bacterium]|nr:hypothetical protein [Candidatus Neomarinimicrobiota bacterium]MCF7842726.1 hypothetical protein [Lentisphaeria bacterium]
MKVHAFKVGDYAHTHERQAFRKLCERLVANPADQEVYLIANVTLPDVEYRPPGWLRSRTYRGVSPDIIFLKKDAIAVLELKAYPGLITFPVEKHRIWDPWTYEYDGLQGVINESGASPYQQVKNNAQAVIAFLKSYEQQFADDESKDSLWYKLQKVILFSAANVRFKSPPPDCWRGTTIASLDSEAAAEYDITKYLSDLTSAPIHYKTDPRPQIHLTHKAINNLVDILGAEAFSLASAEPSTEQIVFPEYGIQPIIALGTRMVVTSKREESQVEIPESVLREPVPMRVLRYYIDCVQELAKQGSSIDLSKSDRYHFIQNCPEPVFFGEGRFMLNSEHIPDRFLTPDARFTYGYLPVIAKQAWRDTPTFNADPLFMRDMRIVREKGEYFCQSLSEDEVTVNRSALRHFKAIHDLSTEEVENLLREVETAGSIEDQIRFLLDALGIDWKTTFKDMGSYDYSALNEGLLPLGVLFQSTSGVYNRLLKDMGKMRDAWSTQPKTRNNLAWRMLDNFAPEHVTSAWKPARLCVIPSNYEQTKSVGLAIEEESLLQVISGPPGTGKTQVIQNIIVNATDMGWKLIFASRNNKAVDVVVDRMNGGILTFPFVFRTGSNHQNQKFATFLNKLDPLNTDQFLELKSQEHAIRGELRQLSGKLQQLHQGLLEAQKAHRDMEETDQEMESLRDQNESLFALTNWYERQEQDLGVSIWRDLTTEHEREVLAGAGLFNRLVQSYRRGIGMGLAISRRNYNDLLEKEFIRQLNNRLPQELILTVGRENLIAASQSVLPILEKLNELSQRYSDGQEILKKYDESRILKEWNEIELTRIEPSKKMLTLDWHKRRNDTIIHSVTNLLEDWRSQTPFEDVLKVFPCCATTTLSVGNKIPMSSGLFDLAVIDEASQADVASCLPVLYRARRAVIIGDEMQLRPVVTLSDAKNAQLLKAYGLDGESYRRYDFCVSSMLDLANDRFTAAGGRRLLLKDHYRCHPDIIDFSNRCFYNGSLRIRTSRNGNQGIFLHSCEGEAHQRWRNPTEIDAVEDLVVQAIKAGYDNTQIGVVTPFRQQAEAIINRLRTKKLFAGDSGFITVSTAHGFQGDERDIMIFSLVVADNMPKGTIQWVHDITTDSKNLLNVAITRARHELHVVTNEKLCTKTGGLLGELMAHCKSHS